MRTQLCKCHGNLGNLPPAGRDQAKEPWAFFNRPDTRLDGRAVGYINRELLEPEMLTSWANNRLMTCSLWLDLGPFWNGRAVTSIAKVLGG